MIGDDWFALLTELQDAEVRFVVVGAHAMAVHGFPRATQDLDVGKTSGPAVDERTLQISNVWMAAVDIEAIS